MTQSVDYASFILSADLKVIQAANNLTVNQETLTCHNLDQQIPFATCISFTPDYVHKYLRMRNQTDNFLKRKPKNRIYTS